MSHRVTTETEMKNKEHVKTACKAEGVTYTENGDSLHFTSGALQGATLNLKNGQISGDTDFGHTSAKLGALRQAYGEANYRFECLKQGIQVESKSIEKNGDIVLICVTA